VAGSAEETEAEVEVEVEAEAERVSFELSAGCVVAGERRREAKP
jgi:hypothetical protein